MILYEKALKYVPNAGSKELFKTEGERMTDNKEFFQIMCDKLDIKDTGHEEILDMMMNFILQQSECRHDFVSDAYENPLRKGYEICTKCGKQRINLRSCK